MDPELANRFANGEPQAVPELYREFGGAVFAVAFSILRDTGLAADATQEAFVKAWRNAETFDPTRDFGPWIYSIARHTAIDLLRKRGDREVVDDQADDVDIPDGIERVWETFQVRRAVDRLPYEEREVVRLTHLMGFTHTETAEHLNIPVGTVKSRSSRAHRRLAVWLAHMVGE